MKIKNIQYKDFIVGELYSFINLNKHIMPYCYILTNNKLQKTIDAKDDMLFLYIGVSDSTDSLVYYIDNIQYHRPIFWYKSMYIIPTLQLVDNIILHSDKTRIKNQLLYLDKIMMQFYSSES